MIVDLINSNETLGKEMVEYYIRKYNGISNINSFIKSNEMYQVGFILDFLHSKNIGMLVDLHHILFYYVNPFINANNILKHFNEKGELTDMIEFIDVPKEHLTIIDAYRFAFEYAFNIILRPF